MLEVSHLLPATISPLYPFLSTALLSFLVSVFFTFFVAKYGLRFALIDNPNVRSSHSKPTSRGGGVGIWIGFLLLGVFIIKDISFTLIAGTTGLIGFLEDIFTLSSKLRLLVQLIISAVIVMMVFTTSTFVASAVLFVFWLIFIVGTTNFYNFMDGINGIAGLTGLVGFGLMAYLSYFVLNAHNAFLMSAVLAAGCLGFLPFNFPRALVFMGDVGSIFLGFVFASFVAKLSTSINVFLCLLMFLSTFYADAVITIYYRWRRGENLMQAHRSHLYQYLSNELKLPHWQVSLMYAIVQLFFGILSLLAYQNGVMLQLVVLVVFSILFVISYNMVKKFKPKIALQ